MIVHRSPPLRVPSASLIAILVVLQLCGNAAKAQESSEIPRPIVEDLVRRLDEQERELNYLSQRDTQRQAWEESFADRMPTTGDRFASVSNLSLEAGSLVTPGDETSQKAPGGC